MAAALATDRTHAAERLLSSDALPLLFLLLAPHTLAALLWF
jgi:hypothetical protein